MTDDAGFGLASTFGDVVPTPHLDRIANTGMRYTQFHSTVLCSPTRAALITGRNHHSVGFGVISEAATGFPGYDSFIITAEATGQRLCHLVVRQGPKHAGFRRAKWAVRSRGRNAAEGESKHEHHSSFGKFILMSWMYWTRPVRR
jgi:Sulfatase